MEKWGKCPEGFYSTKRGRKYLSSRFSCKSSLCQRGDGILTAFPSRGAAFLSVIRRKEASEQRNETRRAARRDQIRTQSGRQCPGHSNLKYGAAPFIVHVSMVLSIYAFVRFRTRFCSQAFIHSAREKRIASPEERFKRATVCARDTVRNNETRNISSLSNFLLPFS